MGETDEKVLTRSSNPGQKQPTVITGKRLNPFKTTNSHNILVSRLVLKHVAALEIKRFHHSKRNKKGILCEIIMPAAFVCLAMCMTLILPGLEEEPPLEMNPWIYPTKVDDIFGSLSYLKNCFRVARARFSLQMTTRNRTGRSATRTPCCRKQGSAQSASMGEEDK